MATQRLAKVIVVLWEEDGEEFTSVITKAPGGGNVPVLMAVGMLTMATNTLLHPPPED